MVAPRTLPEHLAAPAALRRELRASNLTGDGYGISNQVIGAVVRTPQLEALLVGQIAFYIERDYFDCHAVGHSRANVDELANWMEMGTAAKRFTPMKMYSRMVLGCLALELMSGGGSGPVQGVRT